MKTIHGGFRPDHPIGLLVEIGDRVQLRRDIPWAPAAAIYGAWGTIKRRLGLGHVRLCLDNGVEFNAAVRDLQFEKRGRPLPEVQP